MADSLNIKNPSVRQGDLDLRTDASGNIVSISGHPIAGGGGGGGTTYYGDNEYIQIKNGTVNTFTVTDKVKNVVDNLTVEIAEQIDAQTYNKDAIDTKLSEKQDELVFAGYDDKIETINGSGFIVNGYVSDTVYQIDKNNFNKKIDYLSASVSGKEDKLTFEYDEDNKVSAINGSALAGQGGTTYTPGQYINIDSNNEISVTGLVAIDEYSTYSGDWNDVSNSYKTNSGSFLTSEALTNYATKTYVDGKDPVLIGDSNITAASSTVDGHTQWNLSVNATPVVTDTKLVGDNCVTAHTTTNSGEWIVGLEQTAYEAIGSVGVIATDVTTLKNASANWNKVSDKLDTAAAAQTYLEKTTYASDSATFALKTQLDDYYEKTDTSSKTELSTEFAKYQVVGDYATKTDISDMATQTWVGQQGFYTKASGDNDYAPKSVTATINTLTAASAGWNDVTAKLDKSIYSNASGNWENTYNTVNQYSAAGTWLTQQSLTNYYTKDETSGASELSTEFAKYVTSSNVSTPGTDYVMTTSGWKVLTLPGGGMTQVIHDETLTGQGNDSNSKLGVAWSALSGNTINSAKSAEYITNGVGYSGFNDISAKFDSLTSYVPYSATVLPIGTNNTATNNSIAIGASNTADDLGFAVGQSNTALKRSLAFGVNNYANDISLAIGYQNSASGRNDNNQSAVNIAIGYANSAADHAAAFINVCTAENYAFAAGHGNSAIDNSVAFGRNTSAYFYSFDFGHSNDVRYYSYAFGRELHYEGQWANGSQYGAFVIGGWNATTSYATTADAPLFIIGNGSNNNPSDGFIVYRDGDYVNSSFLPTSGGTVSGELVVSAATGTFDNSYVKCVNNGNDGYARFGVGSYGGAVIKAVNGNNNVQVNVKYNANNNELIQVQKSNTAIGFLIPAQIHTGSYTPTSDDGILHIVLES